MNATVLTTVIGLVITAVATIGFPLYLNRSRTTTTAVAQESVDSREVARMFKGERDRLQLRLDTMQADYERRMAALRVENAQAMAVMKATWDSQHERDQTQITELRAELQGVYRQLYQQNPPPRSP